MATISTAPATGAPPAAATRAASFGSRQNVERPEQARHADFRRRADRRLDFHRQQHRQGFDRHPGHSRPGPTFCWVSRCSWRLAFEFVNGFHDTANAVATVIYTHSLDPQIAVVWSGFWNFAGVVTSTGAVAFGIVSLLPVELILQVGIERRLRDGLRVVDRRHPLEPGHLVVRSAGLQLAHADRLDHRRRHRQPAHERALRNQRRRLGAGGQHRSVAAALPGLRIRAGRHSVSGDEGAREGQAAVRSARRHRAASVLDSRPC